MRKHNRFKKLADVIKAMSHPTRLIIIDALTAGERCVCELNSLVDIDQSTISRHLSVLKNAGIIEDDKRGLNVYYSLKCPCVLTYLDCIEKVINSK